MGKPYFSIIIPTLDEEVYLQTLLSNLKKQKFKDFEILVVDGKSADKTASIARFNRRFFKELRLIISRKRNVCYQRNLGAQKAKGEYLIFLDADVQIYTSYLQAIYDHIQETGAKFISTYQLPDTRRRIDLTISQIVNYALELLIVINKQMAPEYNFIIEKKLFFECKQFDIKATFSEGHDLGMRIGKRGVTLSIVKRHLLRWSFRRLRKDGHLPIIIKYSWTTLYSLLFGKITDKNFSYPMGGSYYKKVLKEKHLDLPKDLVKYFAKIKNIFTDLFVE